MAPENFILSPCTPADIPEMIEVYLNAFAGDVLGNFTFPREEIGETEMRRWMTAFLTSHFAKPEMHSYKMTETNTGIMAAWMRCAFPHSLTEEEKEKRKLQEQERAKRDGQWPRGANLEVIGAKFGMLMKLKEKYCNDLETYYLQLLATDPAYQRRGLASKLLKHVLDSADREGKKAYIEATLAGYPVYERLGWKVVDVVEIDLSKWGGKGMGSNRIMLREPQPLF